MKKIIEGIGLVSLIAFSFFFTEKTAMMVRDMDDIMVEIKKECSNDKEPFDAKIEGNTIIPGVSGTSVDIEKSYYNMKRLGFYNSSMLVYKKTVPNISIKNNYNKYVIRGNSVKKAVSLVFKVDNDSSLDKVLNILDNNNIKGNFFASYGFFKNNNSLIIDLLGKEHVFGLLASNYSTKESDSFDGFIKKIGKQDVGYCYVDKHNDDVLSDCSNNNNYTILPNIIVKSNPLLEVKKGMVNGSVIAFNINNKLENELQIIIDYIKSKDKEIITLNHLLEE